MQCVQCVAKDNTVKAGYDINICKFTDLSHTTKKQKSFEEFEGFYCDVKKHEGG